MAKTAYSVTTPWGVRRFTSDEGMTQSDVATAMRGNPAAFQLPPDAFGVDAPPTQAPAAPGLMDRAADAASGAMKTVTDWATARPEPEQTPMAPRVTESAPPLAAVTVPPPKFDIYGTDPVHPPDTGMANAVMSGTSQGLNTLGQVAARGAQAYMNLSQAQYKRPLALRAAELQIADEAAKTAENLYRANALEEQIRAQQDADTGLSAAQQYLNRNIAGAANSLTSMVPAMVMGPLAPEAGIALAGLTEGTQAYQEGKDQGKSGVPLATYAATQGLIEAIPAAIFQKIPGWHGLEDRLKIGIRGAAEAGYKAALKAIGMDTLKEMPEEVITETLHNVAQVAAGTDQGQATNPLWWGQTILDTITQTALMGGAMGAPSLAAVPANQRAAEAEADRMTPPSLPQDVNVEQQPTPPQEAPAPPAEVQIAPAPEVAPAAPPAPPAAPPQGTPVFWRDNPPAPTPEAPPVVDEPPQVSLGKDVTSEVTPIPATPAPPEAATVQPTVQPAVQPAATTIDDVPEAQRFEAVTPQEDVRVRGRWRVVDAQDLITSNLPAFDQGLQPRDRSNQASLEQIAKIAAAPDPARLMDSPVTDSGAPIIDNRGMVISGNGRTLGLSRAYASGRAKSYEATARAQAERLGLSTEGIARPVLVREIQDTGGSTLERIAELSNRPQILQRNAVEQAEADAKVLPKLMPVFAPSQDGDVRAVSNHAFLTGFVQETGDQSLRTTDGGFAPGVDGRVRNAVLAAVLLNGDANRQHLGDAMERADELGLQRVMTGVAVSGGNLLRLRETKPALDITPVLGQAITELLSYRKARADGSVKSIEQHFAQSDMFSQQTDPMLAPLVTALDGAKSIKAVKSLLDSYTHRAAQVDTTTGSLFGNAVPATTPQELMNLVLEDKGDTQQQNLFAASIPPAVASTPAPPSTRADATAVPIPPPIPAGPPPSPVMAALHSGIAERTGKPVNPEHYTEAQAPATESARKVATLSQRLGTQVQWMNVHPQAPVQGGAYQEGVVYLNVNDSRPHEAVAVHEILHDLELKDPKAYNQVVTAIADVMGTEEFHAYAKEYKRQYAAVLNKESTPAGDAALDADIRSEFISFVGEGLGHNQSFWDQLARSDMGVVQRLLDGFRKLLRRIAGAPRAKGTPATGLALDAVKAIRDVHKVEAAIVKALAKAKTNPSVTAGKARFSLQQDAEALQAKAEADKRPFLYAVAQAGRDMGWEYRTEFGGHAVKGIKRIVEKMREGKAVTDPLRSTLVITDGIPSEASIQKVIASMEKRGYKLIPGEIDNLFDNPRDEYRHVAYKFEKNGDGLPRELIIIEPNMLAAKDAEGHVYYDITRGIKAIMKMGGFGSDALNAQAEQVRKITTEEMADLYDWAFTQDRAISSSASVSAPNLAMRIKNPGRSGRPTESFVASTSRRELLRSLQHPMSASSRNLAISDSLRDVVSALEKSFKMNSEAVLHNSRNDSEASGADANAVAMTNPSISNIAQSGQEGKAKFSIADAATRTAKGEDSPGRPDLANPGQTEDARRAVRNVQTELGDPEARKWNEVSRIANTLDATAVAKIVLAGAELNDAETFKAVDVMQDAAADAVKSGNWKQMSELARGWIQGGTELGRAMAARRDRVQTPEARLLQAIALGMAVPVGKVKKKLDKIDADIKKIKDSEKITDKFKLDNLQRLHNHWMRQHEAEVKKFLERLAEKDIVIADLLNRLSKLKPEEQTLANPTVIEAVTAIRTIQTRGATMGDAVYEYWISSLLSGPTTHIVNVSSNMLHGIQEFFVERPLQILINTAMRKEDGAQWGEMKYLLRGMGPGFVAATRNALLSYRTERAVFQEDIKFHRANRNQLPGVPTTFGYASEHNTASIAGAKGRFVRTSLRGLLAEDEFSKSLFGHMEVGAQAYRAGKAKGLSGDALSDFIAEEVGDKGSDSWAKALHTSVRLTYQEKMSDEAEAGSAWVGSTPLAYIVPFRRTPINIFKTGLRKTPLGILGTTFKWRKLGDDEKVRRVTEGVMSLALTAGLTALLGVGGDDDNQWLRVTGSLPWKTTKPGLRDLAARTLDKQSIRIGDLDFSYARLDPMATALSTAVDMITAIQHDLKGMDPYENLADFTAKLGAMITDKTFMRGVGDMVAAVQDPTKLTDWAKSFAASWVPNIVKQVNRAADTSMRDTKGAGATGFLQTATGYGGVLPTKVNLWGQPVEKFSTGAVETDFLFRLLSPVTVTDRSDKLPLPKQLDRLLLNFENQNPGEGYAPQMPNRYIQQDKKRYDLNNEQYAEFCKTAGEWTLKQLKGAKLNAAEPTARDIEQIKDAIEFGRKQAKLKALRDLRKK